MKQNIRIGTRGSKLAIYQAEQVKKMILQKFPEINAEIVTIKTKGDIILDVALSKIGDKGLFTKEIENALLDESIDLAVHSLKDLPTVLPKGLKLGAVLERGEFRDALISKNGKRLQELGSDDIIATSSLRRIAGLRIQNGQIKIKDIRGNVQTRLKRMEEGYCDALIMAAAGFQRLGLENLITEIIEPETILPAVGQGAIAIEIRKNDPETEQLINQVNHIETWTAITAERAFLNHLEGGCQVPLGCYTSINNGVLTITGFVSSVDGKNHLKETISGKTIDASQIGIQLAEEMLKNGASSILKGIKKISH